MSKATQRERWEFIHLIMKHTTVPEGEAQRAALKLLRYGATYSRIQEFECNAPDAKYGQDEYNKRMQERWEREQERNEKKEARITELVTQVCKSIGCEPVFQGDPRGATIKVKMPDGYTNDWGREGICVPTA
jgi:hypothetical protein